MDYVEFISNYCTIPFIWKQGTYNYRRTPSSLFCLSVGISQSVNNVLESESIVVPVNTMWSLSSLIFLLYSKCKVAFILRALEGIISHFTGEIVSALLPITDANKTQQPICQNICIALKWWKLERLSDTGARYYPVQGCHDWQSPSKESGKMKKEGLG